MSASGTVDRFDALGFDPAPGDLGRIGELTTKYRTVSATLRAAFDSLDAIVHQRGAVWQGQASEAFARRVGRLPEYLARARDSMGRAADALQQWEQDLGELKARARELELRARRAAATAEAARANPDLHLTERTFTDPESLRRAQTLLDHAGAQLQDALDDCTAVQQDAQRLLAQHTQLAEQVAAALDAARRIAPEEPGLLDGLVEGLTDAVDGLGNAILDGVDQVRNFLADHANIIAKLSDVAGDVGNVLGIVGEALPPPVGEAVGAVATGLGLTALGGHAAAKALGAEVAPETLYCDGFGVLTSALGVIEGPVGTGAKILGYTALEGQLIADGSTNEVADKGTFAGPIDDLDDYWKPRNGKELAMTIGGLLLSPGALVGPAAARAIEQGDQLDHAPQRLRERAEQKAWQ